MFVFNFGIELLEQSFKLGRLVIFDFPGNSLLLKPLSPDRRLKSSAFYSVSLLELFFSYCIVVAVAK